MPYLTPDAEDNPVQLVMAVPGSFVQVSLGAIYELSLEENWEQYGDLTEAESAAIMGESYRGVEVKEMPRLRDSLAGHWSMEETSGNRANAVGSGDLVDHATVDYESGKVGNAAKFLAANSEYLTLADSDLTRFDNRSFTFTNWFRFDTSALGQDQYLFSKYKTPPDGNRDFFLRKLTTNILSWNVSALGSIFTRVDAGTFGAIVANAWYFAVARYDHENELASISINQVYNAATHQNGVHVGNDEFRVGRLSNLYLSGGVDELSIYNHAISRVQEAWLYNLGNGRSYADILAYTG